MAQGAFGFQNPKITLLPLRSLQWSVYKLMLSNVPLTTTIVLLCVTRLTRVSYRTFTTAREHVTRTITEKQPLCRFLVKNGRFYVNPSVIFLAIGSCH